jgi:putative transposase
VPVNKKEYRRSRHAVHAVKQHFVFCPKRRKRVLKGAVARRLRQILEGVRAEENEWEIVSLAIRPDPRSPLRAGRHPFVQADPRPRAPYQIVHAFKAKSSRYLRDEYPHLL